MSVVTSSNPLRDELSWLTHEATAQQPRTMRQFAEEEIVLPSGPFAGYRFDCDRQPYSKLFFAEVDCGRYNRIVSTGCVQSGKSLLCYVIPILYHLFELNETVVMGVADLKMATDKWESDLYPVIMKTRYRELLPSAGPGSEGGKVFRVDFKNGAVLRIMSGGGDDKMISAFTSRIIAATEIDGWATIKKSRKVADPITELENRASAFDQRKRVFMECTLTTKEGRTYQEITNGTDSKIILRCPHCGAWVRPEREHVVGWQDARSEVEAHRNGAFACPSCARPWSEEERIEANHHARLIHRGQEVGPDGEIHGDPPETFTFGFRWSAVNNLLLTSGAIAMKLWNAARMEDQQSAERQLSQNVFAVPYKAQITDSTPLDVNEILKREGQFGRGIVPPGTQFITVGGDIGKYFNWWAAIAWMERGGGRVIDYGAIEVLSEQYGEEVAIKRALLELKHKVDPGWIGTDGRHWNMSEAWIDAHYFPQAVYDFCRGAGTRWRPIMGWGASKDVGQGGAYHPPKEISSAVSEIGERYHFAPQAAARITLVHVDVDHWKTWVHRRLSAPVDGPGALLFYKGDVNAHKRYALHLTAEHQVEEFQQGKGIVARWVRIRPQNHYLDCTTYAAAAAHHCGIRLMEGAPEPKKKTLAEWFGKKS